MSTLDKTAICTHCQVARAVVDGRIAAHPGKFIVDGHLHLHPCPGSGMAVEREAKREPFTGAETFALMDENFYRPCGEVLGKLQAFCTKMENERDGLRVEYESRVIWIDRIIEILGCKNNDGFHCVDVHAFLKTKLARADALAVAAKAFQKNLHDITCEEYEALQSALAAYETGGEE